MKKLTRKEYKLKEDGIVRKLLNDVRENKRDYYLYEYHDHETGEYLMLLIEPSGITCRNGRFEL